MNNDNIHKKYLYAMHHALQNYYRSNGDESEFKTMINLLNIWGDIYCHDMSKNITQEKFERMLGEIVEDMKKNNFGSGK